MPNKEHHYSASVEWTGNQGTGTWSYRGYARDHVIGASGRPPILASSDPAFRGDGTRWNPEQLLVASLASCHQLWYLHLCADAGVAVMSYRDDASGIMLEDGGSGAGRFSHVLLRPQVGIRAGDDLELATRLHRDAHAMCFLANSVKFEVACEPSVCFV
jgi:organic hydroperoxide reductase OsmC/OhrA